MDLLLDNVTHVRCNKKSNITMYLNNTVNFVGHLNFFFHTPDHGNYGKPYWMGFLFGWVTVKTFRVVNFSFSNIANI